MVIQAKNGYTSFCTGSIFSAVPLHPEGDMMRNPSRRPDVPGTAGHFLNDRTGTIRSSIGRILENDP